MTVERLFSAPAKLLEHAVRSLKFQHQQAAVLMMRFQEQKALTERALAATEHANRLVEEYKRRARGLRDAPSSSSRRGREQADFAFTSSKTTGGALPFSTGGGRGSVRRSVPRTPRTPLVRHGRSNHFSPSTHAPAPAAAAAPAIAAAPPLSSSVSSSSRRRLQVPGTPGTPGLMLNMGGGTRRPSSSALRSGVIPTPTPIAGAFSQQSERRPLRTDVGSRGSHRPVLQRDVMAFPPLSPEQLRGTSSRGEREPQHAYRRRPQTTTAVSRYIRRHHPY